LGTDHHEGRFTPRALLDLLDELPHWLDEPLADPSILPTHLLSTYARRSVTVALGGDGADELLAGYPTFQADRLAWLYRLPRPVHERLVMPLVERLPVSVRDFSLDFKLKRFVRGMSYPPERRHQAWLGAFPPPALRRVLREQPADPYTESVEQLRHVRDGDRVAQLVYLYVKTYLQDDILAKVDRASMATSLEVRAPFLDYTLVEFLGRVPSRLKLRGLETKYLLKRAMADELPPGIASRRKKGFGIPVAAWLKDELRPLLTDELSPARIETQGIFQTAEVQRLVREHLAGRRDHRKELWTLLVFQLWHRRYLEQPTAAPAVVEAGAVS
jgi:asparagine synthase (glutamine-hydrolysing)